ncbi:hypothetical protein HMPREF3216_01273 [Gardnerella vaginalis]|uniref:Uncharacterized protein n=1 Tax=Gardnerella vaginalis TaxID=2702 RepID=A0A133NM70_GARVA|nr:hypothetical protein HMPREF3216_01273 [Gardnerella vaginalis]
MLHKKSLLKSSKAYSQIYTYKLKEYNVVRIQNTVRNAILKIDIEHAKMYG